ncbi:MAG: EF-P lysine aminoacylase EpmA [Xanthomonadales bacterium]|nr:EF-P lysine aminoacylase EpmA [Xanthomonadales bacterium]
MTPEPAQSWRPNCSTAALRLRAVVLREIRAFLDGRGVLEVETPVLSRGANTDPNIESFELAEGWYLRTSAEFPMKRLLAAGSGPIYELGRVFRRSEAGRWHNPEFTMLEWYRPGLDYHALIDEVFDLIRHVAQAAGHRIRGSGKIAFAEAFREITDGIDPLAADALELSELLRRRSWFEGALSRREAMDLIIARGLPQLCASGELLAVYDFPIEMAALASASSLDPRVAQRFEVYLDGMELANGYQELTDAAELESRIEHENRSRAERGQAVLPADRHLLAAQRSGLPECAGVALGVDRLIAAVTSASCLDEVMAFTADRA